jgi:hypothetical protein
MDPGTYAAIFEAVLILVLVAIALRVYWAMRTRVVASDARLLGETETDLESGVSRWLS